MRPPPLTRSRRALYGLIVACCLVGLAEIGLRLNGVGPAYQADRLGQWQTTPNLRDHRMKGSREPHDFVLTTNADGLRTEAGRARTPDTHRVALMGDSNVFGWGLGNDQTLAAQTESVLQAAGHSVEIINAGQPGYSTAQVSWLFEKTIAAYQPDLTVVFLSMHDHNRVLISDTEAWRGPQGPTAWLRVGLARHSRIYESIRRMRHARSSEVQLMPDDTDEGARVRRVSDAERASLLADMLSQASAWGGTIALGLLPDVADLRNQGAAGHLPGRMGQDWAEAWSAEAERPMVNLRDCCPEGGEALVFPFDHGHMNAAGNTAAAAALARAIASDLP